MQGQKRQGGRRRAAAKPKVCRFCEAKVRYIDFKDAETLMKFQTERARSCPAGSPAIVWITRRCFPSP